MIIRAEHIKRDFIRDGKGTNIFTAVEPVDFTVDEGKLTEIVGRSGSGKTTFVNMLAGLLKPTEGRVFFGDEDIYAMDDRKLSSFRNRHIGVIPQGQTGLSTLTVLENVTMPALMYDKKEEKEKDIEARAVELLEVMDIADLKNVYANELSGGELRRMSIARALINNPELVVADEPTGDLDDETTGKVLKLLKNYCSDKGASVIMVTHEKDAAAYADTVYRMDKGVIRIHE